MSGNLSEIDPRGFDPKSPMVLRLHSNRADTLECQMIGAAGNYWLGVRQHFECGIGFCWGPIEND